MKIRPHASALEESMERVTEVKDLRALLEYVKREFGFLNPTDTNIEFAPYSFDQRIGWDTYLITVDGKPVLLCDGPPDTARFPLIERLRKRVTQTPNDTLIPVALEWLEEYEHMFDLRWKADMRAIKRWQQAHPGKPNVWPDHADLVVWLMDQLEAVRHPDVSSSHDHTD